MTPINCISYACKYLQMCSHVSSLLAIKSISYLFKDLYLSHCIVVESLHLQLL